MIKILITALGFILLSAVTLSQMEIVSAAPGGNGNSNKPTSPKVKPTSPRHSSNNSTQVTFTGVSRFISLI